jgi:hypothetical protein
MPRRHRRSDPDPAPVRIGGDRATSCTGKTRFGSRVEAQERADEFGLGTGTAKGVYRCPHCQGWHVGGAASDS